MTKIAILEDRAVIAVQGAEAHGLLNGLVTNDLEPLASGKPVYAALLTPQGKVQFDFLIVKGAGENEYLLDCAADAADRLLKRLTLYRLRAKVVLERRDMRVAAAWNGEAALPGISYADPRLTALGSRALVSAGEEPETNATADDYTAHRLSLGVPQAADFGFETCFALEADLADLNAISFTKGCYVGQELTARMKHRGTARKRLLLVQSDAALPDAGTNLTTDGKAIGEILSVHGATGFALVRLDRLAEAGDAPIMAGETTVSVIKPAWLAP
ncbi:MAG TPA: hypothetical protein VFI93_07795 [Rhizomicrobium sp.]|nr:hypothetical protein [Rhizomicrobium sp.]